MKKNENGKVTKQKLMEMMEDNIFYSRMAAQKAGHAGLIAMAAYPVLRGTVKGKEDNVSRTLLTVSMLMLIFDDISMAIHAGKKLKSAREENV